MWLRISEGSLRSIYQAFHDTRGTSLAYNDNGISFEWDKLTSYVVPRQQSYYGQGKVCRALEIDHMSSYVLLL